MPKKKQKTRKITHPNWFDQTPAVYKPKDAAGKPYLTVATHVDGAQTIIRLAQAHDLSNVLEIGSGPNPISLVIGAKKLTLFDLLEQHHEKARQLIANLRERALGNLPKVNFVTGDAREPVPPSLEQQHFSLVMINEMLTHVRPENRRAFLERWGARADSLLIVDRHLPDAKLLAQYPEFMDGNQIRRHLQEIGFTHNWIGIRNFDLAGDGERQAYFFVAATKKPLKH